MLRSEMQPVPGLPWLILAFSAMCHCHLVEDTLNWCVFKRSTEWQQKSFAPQGSQERPMEKDQEKKECQKKAPKLCGKSTMTCSKSWRFISEFSLCDMQSVQVATCFWDQNWTKQGLFWHKQTFFFCKNGWKVTLVHQKVKTQWNSSHVFLFLIFSFFGGLSFRFVFDVPIEGSFFFCLCFSLSFLQKIAAATPRKNCHDENIFWISTALKIKLVTIGDFNWSNLCRQSKIGGNDSLFEPVHSGMFSLKQKIWSNATFCINSVFSNAIMIITNIRSKVDQAWMTKNHKLWTITHCFHCKEFAQNRGWFSVNFHEWANWQMALTLMLRSFSWAQFLQNECEMFAKWKMLKIKCTRAVFEWMNAITLNTQQEQKCRFAVQCASLVLHLSQKLQCPQIKRLQQWKHHWEHFKRALKNTFLTSLPTEWERQLLVVVQFTLQLEKKKQSERKSNVMWKPSGQQQWKVHCTEYGSSRGLQQHCTAAKLFQLKRLEKNAAQEFKGVEQLIVRMKNSSTSSQKMLSVNQMKQSHKASTDQSKIPSKNQRTKLFVGIVIWEGHTHFSTVNWRTIDSDDVTRSACFNLSVDWSNFILTVVILPQSDWSQLKFLRQCIFLILWKAWCWGVQRDKSR